MRKLVAVMALCSLVSATAFAGGFEKAIMTSAHYGGLAGAGASIVNDAEALYLNPAGLAQIQGLNFSANFSPTFSQFEGPVSPGTGTRESETGFSPIFSGVLGITPIEKLGIGVGVYVPGGTSAEYEGVPASAAPGAPTGRFASELQIVEASIGAGYELLDGLRVGAAWRVPMIGAELAFVGAQPVEIKDISKTKFNGFRAGAQYAPVGSRWGVGASYRSKVDFEAEGDVTIGPTAFGKATISNTFPMAADLGAYFDLMPNQLRLVGQWTWTKYSDNELLRIVNPAINTTLQGVPQNWDDQHNFRIAAQYTGLQGWALRGGYVLTTAVVPEEFARATFSSPGLGHTLVLGAGTKVMSDMLTINGALEYSMASGDGAGSTAIPGEYSSKAYAAHIGATYSL